MNTPASVCRGNQADSPMCNRVFAFCAALLFALLVLHSGMAAADVRIISRESLDGHPGTMVTHWFGDGKRARQDGDKIVVTRFDLGKVYLIDRAQHVFRTQDLMLKPVLADLYVTQTQETATIGHWLCHKYIVKGPATHGLRISLWTTKDIAVDSAMFSKMMTDFAHEAGAEWLQAYSHVEGFPVVQEISDSRGGLSQTRRSEVVSADVLSPPPETYLPPRGYRKES